MISKQMSKAHKYLILNPLIFVTNEQIITMIAAFPKKISSISSAADALQLKKKGYSIRKPVCRTA